MTILLTILHVIVCFMLIVVILVQGGRGQGLSGPSFSSGNVQSLFGTQAADFLTKATSVSAILFLFTTIGLNFYETHKSHSLLKGARQAAPVDIDAVKKALEKVKAESATTSATAKKEVSALVDQAKTAIPNTPVAASTVEAASAQAAANAKQNEKDLVAAAQKTVTAATDTTQKLQTK